MLRVLQRSSSSFASLVRMSEAEVVKGAEEAFEKAFSVPTVKSAKVEDAGRRFRAVYTKASVALGKNVDFAVYGYDSDGKCITTPPQTLPENLLTTRSGDVSVEILKTKNDKGDDMEGLTVYNVNTLYRRSVNLTDLDLHGAAYFDQELGGIAINRQRTKAAFIAEAKKPKNKPFMKAKADVGGDKKEEEKEPFGQEYAFREEFGEQMVGKGRPVIVVVDLETMKVSLPYQNAIAAGWAPGQLVFADGDRLIGIAVKTEPRRLGMVFCTNRPAVIFSLTESGEYTVLSKDHGGVAARRPRVSPDGQTVVWIERDLAQKHLYPGPHQACFRLVKFDLAAESCKVVVPAVQEAKSGAFAGLYEGCLPRKAFSDSGRFLVCNANVGDVIRPLICDLRTDSFELAAIDMGSNGIGALQVSDVDFNTVMMVYSSPIHAPAVIKAVLIEDESTPISGRISQLRPTVKDLKPINKDIVTKLYEITPKQGHPEKRYAHVKSSAIFIGPAKSDGKPAPLILWPHGGPHSVLAATFYASAYYFNLLGYAILFVNYRGSLGAGNDGVEAILGHIGDTDVKDCHDALSVCLEDKEANVDPDNVFLFGGSHGGFLVTHLAGQYPDEFRAVAARNPVTNCAGMAGVTDIPDWCFNEGGVGFDFNPPVPEQLKVLYEKSPIAHAKKVKAPVLLLIGSKDLRVPPSNGYEYYHTLKALGKEVEMNVYEDNHSLSKVPVNVNVMINTALFFHKAMKK